MASKKTTTAEIEVAAREQAANAVARIIAARESIEHLERREYGVVRVTKPRPGIQIEQLMQEKPGKRETKQ